MKNLSTLSKTELKIFFESFDQIFCDCDGVLMISTKLFVDINKPINKLKSINKDIAYVSNNTSERRGELVQKLKDIGIDCKIDDFLTPAAAIIEHLRKINFDKKIFLMSLPGLRKDLESAGFTIYKTKQSLDKYEAEVLKSELEDFTNEIGAVIICIDFNMTVLTLNKVINYLINNDNILFFTTGNDETLLFPMKRGNICLGPGYFQQIVTKMTQRVPIVYGKPSKDFANFLVDRYPTNCNKVLFIGDSLEQDISFGKYLGYKQLLVLSGNTKLDDLNTSYGVLPDYYIDSLMQLDSLIDKAYS